MYFLIIRFCFVYFGCAGSVRIFWRAGSYISCVGLRCVECRAGTILFEHSPGVDGGTVQIFLFSVSVVAGTVRLKWWGVVCFLFNFFSLLSCGCLW